MDHFVNYKSRLWSYTLNTDDIGVSEEVGNWELVDTKGCYPFVKGHQV